MEDQSTTSSIMMMDLPDDCALGLPPSVFPHSSLTSSALLKEAGVYYRCLTPHHFPSSSAPLSVIPFLINDCNDSY